MKIYHHQILPTVEYIEGQEEKHLPPKQGYEVVSIKKNFGTTKKPKWGVMKMYLQKWEDLTIQIYSLRNQLEQRDKLLQEAEARLTRVWDEKVQLENLLKQQAEVIGKYQKEQEDFLEEASLLLQEATSEAQTEATSVMQMILDTISTTQKDIEILKKQK